MSDLVKAACVLAGGAIICVAVWIYFSPFQTCVRAYEQYNGTQAEPPTVNGCVRMASGAP